MGIIGADNYIKFHVALSILTEAVLLIAGALALLLALQERLLRNKNFATGIHKLPPLETMENYLFLVNRWGFILLTAVLCTSLYFYHSLLWQHPIQHPILLPKILLTIMGWVIFLILLIGRHRWGWRGAKAINSTLCAVILLLVVYLASHIGGT